MPTRALAGEELLFLADRNLAEFAVQEALWTRAGEAVVRDDLQLVASGTRFPAALFNCAIALGPAPDTAQAERWLALARAFFGERGRGFTMYVRAHCDAALLEACRACGMRAGAAIPGMVLDAKVPEAPLASGVRIDRVRDVQGVADFAKVAAPAYAMMALPETVTQAAFSEPERLLTPAISVYVAYVDGEPAATVLSFASSAIAGIYWVATRPEMQRRGLADAVTRRASNDAFDTGAACVVLQASPFGEPVYRRMGYRQFTRYEWLFLSRAELAAQPA